MDPPVPQGVPGAQIQQGCNLEADRHFSVDPEHRVRPRPQGVENGWITPRCDGASMGRGARLQVRLGHEEKSAETVVRNPFRPERQLAIIFSRDNMTSKANLYRYFLSVAKEGFGNEIPSEQSLTHYAKVAQEKKIAQRLGHLTLMQIPSQERTKLRFIRGSRIPMNRMPMNNLRLLHKHRNIFRNSANIHRAFINRTTGVGSENSFRIKFNKIPLAEQMMFMSLVKLPVNKLTLDQLALLNKHRELLPNGNLVHRRYRALMTPALKRSQINESRKTNAAVRNKMTTVNKREIRSTSKSAHAQSIGWVILPKNATKLNLTMPHFNAALSSKRINNNNVQEVIRLLKSYSKTKNMNNAPNAPTKPTTTSLNNLKKYRKELANYNSAIRNWIRITTRSWKRNNP
jgi:hypothetical protein